MTVTIPHWLLFGALYSIGWFLLVAFSARRLFVKMLERRFRKGSVVPRWPAYAAMVLAGPIGWGLLLVELWDTYRNRRATKRWHERWDNTP